jgi:hypothetical protein
MLPRNDLLLCLCLVYIAQNISLRLKFKCPFAEFSRQSLLMVGRLLLTGGVEVHSTHGLRSYMALN